MAVNYLNTYPPKVSVCILGSAAAGMIFVTVKAAVPLKKLVLQKNPSDITR